MLAFGFWDALAVLGIALGVAVAFLVAQILYFGVVLAWSDQKTRGLGYYGLSPAERARYKRILRRHSIALWPILRLLSRRANFTFASASLVERGVAVPKGSCSHESFRAALAYRPRPEDVFVATQMKCGTTWMQHVAYEVVHRGRGDLVAQGRTLYAVSPWLESTKSIPVADAALVGTARPSRIIKTHLPAALCPYDAAAKYIYVVRHPVSCFASCVDFVATNIGAFAPPLAVVEQWFCSDDMWWSSWPAHVDGWWRWAQERPNVLFVRFEDMKRDLAAVVQRVAEFLDAGELTGEELEAVLHKCGFAYMKEHADAFEMNPPHLLQADAELFVSGKADRHQDVPQDMRERIGAWSAAALASGRFPLAQHYPDVLGPAHTSA